MRKFNLRLPDDILLAVEEYRQRRGHPSATFAMQELIRMALFAQGIPTQMPSKPAWGSRHPSAATIPAAADRDLGD